MTLDLSHEFKVKGLKGQGHSVIHWKRNDSKERRRGKKTPLK